MASFRGRRDKGWVWLPEHSRKRENTCANTVQGGKCLLCDANKNKK